MPYLGEQVSAVSSAPQALTLNFLTPLFAGARDSARRRANEAAVLAVETLRLLDAQLLECHHLLRHPAWARGGVGSQVEL